MPASLVSLDLAFNWLEDLRGTLAGLQQLPQLRYLRLQGNPFCLVEGYQAAVQQGLPQLQLLDGSELQRAAEQAAPAALQGAPLDAAVGGAAVRPLRGAAAVQVVVQLLQQLSYLPLNQMQKLCFCYESNVIEQYRLCKEVI